MEELEEEDEGGGKEGRSSGKGGPKGEDKKGSKPVVDDPTAPRGTGTGFFSRFPKVFWVSQTFEMLERGAYYSMVPILVIHAYENVGLPLWLASILFAFMYPFQYGLPILTGALAEKIGYKKQIIFAFAFMTVAYAILALAFNAATIILAVVSIGISIGSYKPLISATVAKCTTSKDRNVAYGIYYWIVNLAAFIFPLGFTIAIATGYLPESSYYVVFAICAAMVSGNLVTALFVFEEVPRSGKVKTVKDAVDNVGMAMKDKKFLVMVFLIGGFWAIYAATLIANPVILRGYDWLPWYISVMALGLPNPGTIILLGNWISKYIEKIESMRVMMMGVLVYLIGLIVMTAFLQYWYLVFVGIIIYSIGEFMVAPGYLAFVSKLAEKEKVSAYIGCNFVSNVIGLVGGTIVFGLLVTYVGVNMGRPYLCFGIIIAFGFFLLFLMMMYYRTWGQDIIERAKRIKLEEEGEDEDDRIVHKEPAYFRLFDLKVTGVILLIMIPIILGATAATGTFEYVDPEEREGAEAEAELGEPVSIPWAGPSRSGTIAETSEEDINIEFQKEELDSYKHLNSVAVRLTWTDESAGIGRTNEPDSMGFTLTSPNGESVSAPMSESGSASETLEPEGGNADDYLGTWVLTLECGTCGDITGRGGLVTVQQDNSCSYTVEVEFDYQGIPPNPEE